ncbi:hypothetical protein [Bacillus sp. FJAT-28004]|uniref:hypothetical protein n=1 Tax=Bacillus sp. FJAT-28004 TaxID=1679165 RepID=UPI0006B5DEC2|nr:hypothetical protein [Bacillus sp. FJAT-28004]
MKRNLFYAQLRKDAIDEFRSAIEREGDSLRIQLESVGVLTFSLFISECRLGVYLESLDDEYEWDWPAWYRMWLERWPCENEPRYSIPMLDIFHDGMPTDPASWRGNRHVDKRIGSFARLNPNMAASYVFYHFQKQEEMPESFNKTYIIGAHGPLLFSYYERPSSLSETKKKGILSTNNSPAPSDWHTVMQPHFKPWKHGGDQQEYWQQAELIYGF